MIEYYLFLGLYLNKMLSVEAVITLCHPHIIRKALPENRSKFLNDSNLHEFQKDIKMLHLARSKNQEIKLAELMMAKWRNHGEEAVADYWERHIMKERRFTSVGATAGPGSVANNNPQESYHRDVKRPLKRAGIYLLFP